MQQTEDVRKVAILQGQIDVAVMLEQNAGRQTGNTSFNDEVISKAGRLQTLGNRHRKTTQQGNTKPLKNQTKCKLNQTCGTQKGKNGNN